MRSVLLALTFAATACGPAMAASVQADTTGVTSPRRWVAHAGAGSPHAWNFVGITREFSGGNLRLFATAGFGSFLIGGGAIYYTNPGGTGLALSAAAGLAGAQVAAVLDLRLSPRTGLVLGGAYGSYFLQYVGPLPIAALQVQL